MNITRNNQARRQRGFTLIEMIGVLAIIAVLAGMLVPRVFSAINDSRINSTVMSVNGVKSAAMLYFGKYGKFAGAAGATLNLATTNATDWDKNVLVSEGFLDKPFEAKMGTEATTAVQVVAAVSAATTVTASNAGYDFNSDPATNEAGGGAVVVQISLPGLALDDANAINKALDGNSVAAVAALGSDTAGRVKISYNDPSYDLLIYVAHK
jgi:prepilin-type N-terminal cleavage/methylation domain-containing protein